VDLILPAIFVADSHLLELTGDMIRSTTVSIPVGVDSIPRGHPCRLGLVLVIIFIIAVPTITGFMAGLLADLARSSS
jgi:hypothetical protein